MSGWQRTVLFYADRQAEEAGAHGSAGVSAAGMYRWKCRCICAKEAIVGQTDLQSGKTKSCDCLQEAVILENMHLIDGTSVKLLEHYQKKLLPPNKSGCTGVAQSRTGKWVE